MRLRSNINLLITLVMVVFVVALAALEIDASRRSIREEMEATTRVTVQMLTNLVQSKEAQAGQPSPRVLGGYLERMGRIRAHDIRIDSPVGIPLYESPPSPYKIGQTAPVWFTKLVSPPVNAITLNVGAGKLRILPDASRSVLDAWDELLKLFWLSLALFTLVNLIVFWFAGRALHPVNDKHVLKSAAKGKFFAKSSCHECRWTWPTRPWFGWRTKPISPTLLLWIGRIFRCIERISVRRSTPL